MKIIKEKKFLLSQTVCVVLLFTALFLSNTSAWAGTSDSHQALTSVVISDTFTGQVMGKQLQYLEDPNGEMTIEGFLRPGNQVRLTQSEVDTPNFGYISSAYWFISTVKSVSSTTRQLYWHLDYPIIDEIDVYWLEDGEILTHQTSGDFKPFHHRPIAHRQFLLPFQIEANQELQMVARIRTRSAFKARISIKEPISFWMDDGEETTIQGVYFGIMLVMAV